ncbi:nuclear transport factor 2 family protein [Actinomyces sp. MRS3W]|uniref:nuclear transport factor 2 family protein n=1 Tax=Actinomyces sp. MRS3W TaxID=2800796 RepID=UPI0028FD2C10|nr:nuclear transport factor 2 family protein [Actinomyces sp. MRS3W]MDU0348428.1 nuclear transport factor 2 family protein [Actinomyces sp. MRS3W]
MKASSDGELECVLARFFAAENARDWRAYASFLHPDVEWTLYNHGQAHRRIGREEYLRAIRAAYQDVSVRFRCVETLSDPHQGRIVAVLVNDAGERSLDVFDFDDNLIRYEWEFLLGTGDHGG